MSMPILASLAYVAEESEAPLGAVLDAPVVLDDADTSPADAIAHEALGNDGKALVRRLSCTSTSRNARFGAYCTARRGILQRPGAHHGKAGRDEEGIVRFHTGSCSAAPSRGIFS